MAGNITSQTPKFLLQRGELLGSKKMRCGYKVFRAGGGNDKVQVLEVISYGYRSLMPDSLKEAVNKDFIEISRVIQVGTRTSIAFTLQPEIIDLMNTFLSTGGGMALFFLHGDLYFYLERGGEQRITRSNRYGWQMSGGGPTIDYIGVPIPIYPLPHGVVFNYGLEGYHRIDITPTHSIYVLAYKLPLGEDIKERAKKLDQVREFIDRRGKTIPFTTNYVKVFRDLWGLSLREVEKRGGVAKSTIAYLEQQRNATIRRTTALSLAAALGVAPEELFEPATTKGGKENE